MRITTNQAKPADIVVFKRRGPVSFILGSLLRLFKPHWDGWGWHTAVIIQTDRQGAYVLEALRKGAAVSYYSNFYLVLNTRLYRWLPEPPAITSMNEVYARYVGEPYDIAVYFWTTLAVIARHFINRPVPKLLDNRFSCWELVQEVMHDLGKPLVSRYDVVLISDIMANLEGANAPV